MMRPDAPSDGGWRHGESRFPPAALWFLLLVGSVQALTAAPPDPPDARPDLAVLQESLQPLLDEISAAETAGELVTIAQLQRQLLQRLEQALGAHHPFVAQKQVDLEIAVGNVLPQAVEKRDWHGAVAVLELAAHLDPGGDLPASRHRRWAELYLLRWCLNLDHLDAAGEFFPLRRADFSKLHPCDLQALEWQLLEAQYLERRSDYDRAAGLYAEVERLAGDGPVSIEDLHSLKDHLQLEALAGLAQVATMRGDWDQAEAHCRRWRSLAQLLGAAAADMLAESWLAHAAVLRYSGRLADAEVACRKALVQFREASTPGEPPSDRSAVALNELALIHAALGEPEAAHQAGLEAWNVFAMWHGPDSPVVANLEGNLAEIARRLPLQDRQLLEGFLQQALERVSASSQAPPRVVATLRQTAGLYGELDGHWESARENFRIAAEIREAALGTQHHATARAVRYLARTELALGDLAAAQRHLESAIGTLEAQFGEQHLEAAMARADFGLVAEARGNSAEAERHYRTALARLDAGRARVGVRGLESLGLSEASQVSARLATLLAAEGRSAEATSVWQSALGHSLRDEIAVRQLQTLAPDEFRRLRELEDRHATLVASLERVHASEQASGEAAALLRREIDDLAARLAEQKRRLLMSQTAMRFDAYDLEQIQAQLPADMALIGWVSREVPWSSAVPAHWGVVVRKVGRPHWVPLSRDYASSSAVAVREAISRKDFTPLPELQTQIEALREQVWQPLADVLAAQTQLPAVRRLLVMPSPGLQGVPIDVLVPDTLVVSYAPSGTLYAWLRQRREAAAASPEPRLLALGDPNFDSSPSQTAGTPSTRWAPLPGTRQEIGAIAEACRRRSVPVDVRMGSDASQQTLMELSAADALRQYSFVHLATHGEANPHVPLRSRLILAQDQLPDPLQAFASGEVLLNGELAAEAILRTWTLRAELVTLSACESALGRLTPSEGYVGLSQALLLAGSRSVVSSLWKVDDLATALLMTRFYENLLAARDGLDRPLPKAEALQEAKDWLRTLPHRDAERLVGQMQQGLPVQTRSHPRSDTASRVTDGPYAHPHYWAAFVLIGDAD